MDSGFDMLHRLVKAANARQKVISSNIANADTPGYKAKDVQFKNLLGKQMRMKTTNAKHMGPKNGNDVAMNVVSEPTPSWGDKNNVEMNIEVSKMTENSLMHNTAITMLGTKIRMFKAAIKAGR